ncbi:fumarylacetoacetate hydrolase family protein [Geothrix sp. PMB-07]|uniref:fumarylacetoacetate hydrolase family protein n=1 Tax=Geothrix sp. PMB-07 TaxID=3068640 RepID=UPI002741FF3C|nr:fumarylacetoacetate hydrolase family protein [Geothrix sp. PMB-07]WLT33255.1 fumarylacetoacetate hydrolase family protein [Geothrix sp. PMB-07]
MESVLPIPAVPFIPVQGSSAGFPVRRIYCVGRNYAEHAREMGNDPTRETPCFFSKPHDAVVPGGGQVAYPPATSNLHHEVELVVALAKGGHDIPVAEAPDCIFGYAVGIDLTRRDLQSKAKDKGQPWDTSKGFDQSAPISPITSVAAGGWRDSGAIWLAVNGVEKQRGDLAQMTWSVPEVIAHLSGLFTLAPGDLIFTGTPAGVGPIVRGDRIRCGIDGLGELEIVLV